MPYKKAGQAQGPRTGAGACSLLHPSGEIATTVIPALSRNPFSPLPFCLLVRTSLRPGGENRNRTQKRKAISPDSASGRRATTRPSPPRPVKNQNGFRLKAGMTNKHKAGGHTGPPLRITRWLCRGGPVCPPARFESPLNPPPPPQKTRLDKNFAIPAI